MKTWIFVVFGGAEYVIPSEADSYEDARLDAQSFLDLSDDRFAQFEAVVDIDSCRPDVA